jgi:hypothetical protein
MTRRDLGWLDRAACIRPEHRNLPWLGEPERVRPAQLARMGTVCGRCPVASSCTEHADRHDVTAGFWAGSHRVPGEPVQLTLDLGHLGDTA